MTDDRDRGCSPRTLWSKILVGRSNESGFLNQSSIQQLPVNHRLWCISQTWAFRHNFIFASHGNQSGAIYYISSIVRPPSSSCQSFCII
ncbi:MULTISPECIES: hypothetical protein [unclassified Microcoleus]|uniref:hypothetical protein n=1 Tax=unclassified Microcoleus TaxID=2642155 RepID=UPI0025D919F0|nr:MULTISPECIES: hypothetical protein [unclassified Microcoleus]